MSTTPFIQRGSLCATPIIWIFFIFSLKEWSGNKVLKEGNVRRKVLESSVRKSASNKGDSFLQLILGIKKRKCFSLFVAPYKTILQAAAGEIATWWSNVYTILNYIINMYIYQVAVSASIPSPFPHWGVQHPPTSDFLARGFAVWKSQIEIY